MTFREGALTDTVPVITVNQRVAVRLRAGHLWVFSNEVDNDATPLTGLPVGAMVRQMLAVTNAVYGPESDFTSMVRNIETWAGVEVRA